MVAISCSASVRTVLGSSSCRDRQASTNDYLRRCVYHSPCPKFMQPHNTTQHCQPSRVITEVTSAGGDHLLPDTEPPSPDFQGHTQHTAVAARPGAGIAVVAFARCLCITCTSTHSTHQHHSPGTYHTPRMRPAAHHCSVMPWPVSAMRQATAGDTRAVLRACWAHCTPPAERDVAGPITLPADDAAHSTYFPSCTICAPSDATNPNPCALPTWLLVLPRGQGLLLLPLPQWLRHIVLAP